jgi:hypothetical protein
LEHPAAAAGIGEGDCDAGGGLVRALRLSRSLFLFVRLKITPVWHSMAYDIDIIIERVRAAHPEMKVVQQDRSHPADDNGVWWFRLPGQERDIQIESSTYNCPFIVEHSDMKSSDNVLKAETIDQAVKLVTDYLNSLKV